MITEQFDYTAPDSLETALKLLQETPNAYTLGGGYRLIAEMMQGTVAPALLIDLRNLQELKQITTLPENRVKIGSRTTYSEIARSQALPSQYHALVEAALGIGDPQIRNWETLADTIAYQDLASDILGVALVLEATFNVFNAEGTSTFSAAEYIQKQQQGALTGILTALELPTPINSAGSAYEVMKHPASKRTICGIAAYVESSSKPQCRVAVTGITPYPFRLSSLETQLNQTALATEKIATVVQHAQDSIKGQSQLNSDRYASAEYRAHLMSVLAQRAIQRALKTAEIEV